ncbi:MAG: glycoside hydrolase family 3 C-terminal domain-containing protein [Colwellia sp.]|uniref:glycoside hydrolase family 3 protein n=1 Tax=Pseudoalteromonas sp. S554 TaxID=2066516 RepID=UPI00023193BB|nr:MULTISPECIES: glycoside hydrolase family 3 N-terminal domain-containing protein [unclassified Pseudoalteromonas]MBL1384066.1 glycoside hydrolase family 3 C-terminal domain-containing protein [Colwellia sp.]TMS82535.1 beta-glucosidase [Pseudoalteromonas sp. S554]GAA74241.1 beta-glucosidase [Pseudoalteromonas sp. BSi20480]
MNTRFTLNKIALATLVASVTTLTACSNDNTNQADSAKAHANAEQIWPKLNIAVKKDAEIEAQIVSYLNSMTLEQKVAQMIQPEIRDITVEDMRKYGFGSYLNGGGAFPNGDKHATPQDWVALAEKMYQASIDDSIDGSKIPTMWGTDAVHGHNNVIGATLFPHNIGLGAANNPDLIEQIAAVTAVEVMATGIDWVFAPTVAVVRDDRWGRTYEGYSEDPAIVREYSAAIVNGLQGKADEDFLSDKRVISTVKHFLGDGGTVDGDDQGNNIDSEQSLFDIHAQGYVGGLSAGSQSVMASFNSWNGVKNHGNKYLLTDVLKTRMGFDGFVVGDWNGHGQIKGCTNESCPQAINAGLDIFMVPTGAWKPLYENTIAQVKSGEISMARIDDAVARVLRVKLRAGLFDKPSPANRLYSGKTELIGAQDHREVARQAVRESLVLLKNKNDLLPLSPNQHVLITGDGADNIGKQSGGWSITWQGTNNKNADFPGATSIYKGLEEQVTAAGGKVTLSDDGSFEQKPDVAVVVFGEEPYAEGHGDRDNLEFERGNKKSLALLKSLKAQGINVVSVFISGRPMWVNSELNASDAFVAAWLPGTEGGGVADVLLKTADGSVNHDFKGKLSFSWPKTAVQTTVNKGDKGYSPLLPYGFGLTYGDKNILADNLDENSQLDNLSLTSMDILVGAPVAPWRLLLKSGDELLDVSSSTHEFGAIKYRTEDKVVQEDARQFNFNGSEKASAEIVTSFAEDTITYVEANGVISFDIKLNQALGNELSLAMCSGECGESINLANVVDSSLLSKWQSVSIDLKCYADKGVNFASLTSPFSLRSSGKASVSVSDIKFVPNKADEATLKCK